MINKYGFLGPKGTYSYIALKKFLYRRGITSYNLIAIESIDLLLETFNTTNKLDYIIVPIYNSITGKIYDIKSDNTRFILKTNLILDIKHSLYIPFYKTNASKLDLRIEHIDKVLSHPIALKQCSNFISKYNLNTENTYSTVHAIYKACEYNSIANIKYTGVIVNQNIDETLFTDINLVNITSSNIMNSVDNYTIFSIFKMN